jgi:hypothetical protein
MPSRLLLGNDVSKAMRAAARGQPFDSPVLEREAPRG